MDEDYYDDDSPCVCCEETDPWECQYCLDYAEYIGDDDFDPYDI